MKNHDKNCPETSSTLILYLYGESDKTAVFEAHLEKCAYCRAALKGFRKTLEAYREEAVHVPDTLEIPAHRSVLTGLADLFKGRLRRPAFAGALAFAAAALIIWVVLKAPEPEPLAGQTSSYTELQSKVEDIDNDLDGLFAMNGHSNASNSRDRSGWRVEAGDFEHSEIEDISYELDDIRMDIQTF